MEPEQIPVKIPKTTESEYETTQELLHKRIVIHDDNRKAVLDKLRGICDNLRAQIDKIEDKITRELKEKYNPEDKRLQEALNELRVNGTASTHQRAKAELLVMQSYEIIENKDYTGDLTTLYDLKAEKHIVQELVEMRKPTNVHPTEIKEGNIFIKFTFLNTDEERVISSHGLENPVRILYELAEKDTSWSRMYQIDKNEGDSFAFTTHKLKADTAYKIAVKTRLGDRESEWSDYAEFDIPKFNMCCEWKECPSYVDEVKRYRISERSNRIVIGTKIKRDHGYWRTIIGSISVPTNAVTRWSIKILRSKKSNGDGIYVGIAPFNIDQNFEDNHYECGWYFSCYTSTLSSGPPQNYRNKIYGPTKKHSPYVRAGGCVGVVMDTTKGELSFVLNGVNLGVAYSGIPLDKPLVPCVLLWHDGDSVELII